MSLLNDLATAAELAAGAPVQARLTLVLEGVDLHLVGGSEQLIRLITWSELDGGGPGHLPRAVREAIDEWRDQRDAALGAVSGSRPTRPRRILP